MEKDIESLKKIVQAQTDHINFLFEGLVCLAEELEQAQMKIENMRKQNLMQTLFARNIHFQPKMNQDLRRMVLEKNGIHHKIHNRSHDASQKK